MMCLHVHSLYQDLKLLNLVWILQTSPTGPQPKWYRARTWATKSEKPERARPSTGQGLTKKPMDERFISKSEGGQLLRDKAN